MLKEHERIIISINFSKVLISTEQILNQTWFRCPGHIQQIIEERNLQLKCYLF